MDKVLFSNRLVALRKAHGYSTQYELARAYDDMFPPKRRDEAGGNDGNCGGILGTIKNYENGNNESSPKLEKVCNLCKLLGCDVSYLVGDYDERDFPTHKVAEHTGLSEEAINRLLLETSPHPGMPINEISMISVLNTLLLSSEFWKVVLLLQGYASTSPQALSRSAEIVQDHSLANYGTIANDAAMVKDLIGYRLQQHFFAMIAEVEKRARENVKIESEGE